MREVAEVRHQSHGLALREQSERMRQPVHWVRAGDHRREEFRARERRAGLAAQITAGDAPSRRERRSLAGGTAAGVALGNGVAGVRTAFTDQGRARIVANRVRVRCLMRRRDVIESRTGERITLPHSIDECARPFFGGGMAPTAAAIALPRAAKRTVCLRRDIQREGVCGALDSPKQGATVFGIPSRSLEHRNIGMIDRLGELRSLRRVGTGCRRLSSGFPSTHDVGAAAESNGGRCRCIAPDMRGIR